MISSSSVSCCNNYCCVVDNRVSCCTIMIYSCNSSSSNLKISQFLLLAKNQKPTKEITHFTKKLCSFANYSFNQIPFNYILGPIWRGPSHNMTHPLPIIYSLSYSLTLKLHHFAVHKHIPISFSISLTKSLFLESNITHDITQKTTLATIISSCISYIYINISHTSIYFTNIFLTKYP